MTANKPLGVLEILLGIVVFLVGVVGIYGFGAGYYAAVSVPGPWNLIISAGLSAGLIYLVVLLAIRGIRHLSGRTARHLRNHGTIDEGHVGEHD